MYRDGIDMTHQLPVPGTVFAISRYTKFSQRKDCDPKASNDFSCRGTLYRSRGDEQAQTFYMADIERFTLMFGHGFQTQGSDARVSGDGARLKGYLRPGGNTGKVSYDIEAKDNPLKSAFRIHGLGDVISIGDLIKLTNTEMNVTLDTISHENMPLRYNGCIIIVKVEYSNRQPFDILGQAEPYYTMTARRAPISEFKKMYRESGNLNPTDERIIVDSHGVLVVVYIVGDVMVFQALHLFIVLMTCVALFALARVVADLAMSACMGRKLRYAVLKTQAAKDFSEQTGSSQPQDDFDGICCGEHKGLLAADVEDVNQVPVVQSAFRPGERQASEVSSVRANMLQSYSASGQAPKGEELLYILLNHERRLNYLDSWSPDAGLDHCPMRSRIAAFEAGATATSTAFDLQENMAAGATSMLQ